MSHYVCQSDKVHILTEIIVKFKRVYPSRKTLPYTWIKEQLLIHYGVNTKSIANFFIGMLDRYEKSGGNRNRGILIGELKMESKEALQAAYKNSEAADRRKVQKENGRCRDALILKALSCYALDLQKNGDHVNLGLVNNLVHEFAHRM